MYLTTKRKMMYLVLALSSAGLSYAGTENATAIAAVQQQATCKGVVVDSKGEPIIGASVTAVVNGQKKGAISDLDGNFEIAGIRPGTTLTITYVGYKTQNVVWNGPSLTIRLSLKFLL